MGMEGKPESAWGRWSSSKSFWLRLAIWAACLAAVAKNGLALAGIGGVDIPDPLLFLQTQSGWLGVAVLVACLSASPLSKIIPGGQSIAACRRLLGLWAFAFASIHMMAYVALDQGWDWASILKDVGKRPFVTVGWLGFLAMAPLAATSTKRSMRALGRNWKKLHRLAYAALAFGMLHWYWMREPKHRLASWQAMLGFVALCALARIYVAWKARRKKLACAFKN